MKKTLVILAVSLAACSEAPTGELLVPPAPEKPGMDAGVDAGSPQDGAMPLPDASIPDTSVDAGPPARLLVTHKLLGETPVQNLVVNPMLDLHSAVAPELTSGFGARYHNTESPAGVPVLQVEGGEALIMVQSRPGGLDASIWLGRRGTVAPNASASLVGVGPSQLFVQAELQPANAGTAILDGIAWEQFSGTINESFLGMAFIMVESLDGQTLYVTGPVVESATRSAVPGGVSRPFVALTPLSEARAVVVREAYARFAHRARQSIGLPNVERWLRERRTPGRR